MLLAVFISLVITGCSASNCSCFPLPTPPGTGWPSALPGDAMLQTNWSLQTIFFMGDVQTASGRHFSILYMVYGAATVCPSKPSLTWACMADPASGKFHQSVRDGSDTVSTLNPYSLGDNTWGLRQQPGQDNWQDSNMYLDGPGFQVHLGLNMDRPMFPMAHGGIVDPTSKCLFLHHDMPRISVSGTVTEDGQDEAVVGTMYLNNMREYFQGKAAVEHQWLWLQLSDGYTIQLMQSYGIYEYLRYGNVITPSLTNTLFLDGNYTLILINPWTSPATNTTYHTGARLLVPSFGIDVTIQSYQMDNEVLILGKSVFFEGIGAVSGTHNGLDVTGSGGFEDQRGAQ